MTNNTLYKTGTVMKLRTFIKSLLASTALWAAANTAMAITCDYKDGIKPVDGSMPLQISAITVGRDVPLGAEVYRQTFQVASGQSPIVECKYPPLDMFAEYTLTNSSRANWSSGPYANKVYKTNIDGLGVAFKINSLVMPGRGAKFSTNTKDCKFSSPCPVFTHNLTHFELILVKIGDVKPGVLRGGALPAVQLFLNVNTLKVLGYYVEIAGTIQIVSRTCSTPDVVVPMGTHQTKEFTGLNSASGWQNFSIDLNNCPAFHGTYSTNVPSWTSQSGTYPSGVGTSGSRDNNSLMFRIDAARVAINAPNGVLSLDPSATDGAPAASGVGIQIATPNNAPVPFGKNQSSGLSLRTSEGSYSIPLRARYLQTEKQVTPGPANASATFTITYQ
ncbi:fimbrial protein [Pseudomonas brenneri]